MSNEFESESVTNFDCIYWNIWLWKKWCYLLLYRHIDSRRLSFLWNALCRYFYTCFFWLPPFVPTMELPKIRHYLIQELLWFRIYHTLLYDIIENNKYNVRYTFSLKWLWRTASENRLWTGSSLISSRYSAEILDGILIEIAKRKNKATHKFVRNIFGYEIFFWIRKCVRWSEETKDSFLIYWSRIDVEC